jgi:hypothetical protein
MTPEKVLEILKAHGTEVTIEEAKAILVYLTQLAELEVSDFIKREKEKKFSTINKNNCPE